MDVVVVVIVVVVVVVVVVPMITFPRQLKTCVWVSRNNAAHFCFADDSIPADLMTLETCGWQAEITLLQQKYVTSQKHFCTSVQRRKQPKKLHAAQSCTKPMKYMLKKQSQHCVTNILGKATIHHTAQSRIMQHQSILVYPKQSSMKI